MVIIDENFNICNIHKHMKNVKGLQTGSSPTDAWIISFKNNVFSKDTKLSKGFLKIYLNSSFFKNKDTDDTLEKAVYGLMYETNVYKYVTNPLIDNKICPHFIRLISNGEGCSFNNLLSMLKNNLKKSKSPNKIEKKLKRNIINNLLNYYNDNLSIDESEKYDLSSKYDIYSLKFDMNLTETHSNTLSFYDLLNSNVDESIIFNILFQISFACYSMCLSKMTHNDLHSSNIMLKKLSNPKYILYNINGKEYILKIKYFVYIYDYDRSYSEKLGNNRNLEMYDVFAQTNEFIDNKDMLKIICSVYKYTRNNIFLSCLSNNVDSIKKLISIYDNDRKCNFQLERRKPVKSSFFSNYNNTLTILHNISEFLPYVKTDYVDEMYTCDKNMFDSKGNILK